MVSIKKGQKLSNTWLDSIRTQSYRLWSNMLDSFSVTSPKAYFISMRLSEWCMVTCHFKICCSLPKREAVTPPAAIECRSLTSPLLKKLMTQYSKIGKEMLASGLLRLFMVVIPTNYFLVICGSSASAFIHSSTVSYPSLTRQLIWR